MIGMFLVFAMLFALALVGTISVAFVMLRYGNYLLSVGILAFGGFGFLAAAVKSTSCGGDLFGQILFSISTAFFMAAVGVLVVMLVDSYFASRQTVEA